MRKIIRILIAALCMLTLTATIPFSAFADGKPGAADIAATGDDRIILLPAEDSYLPEARTMYISTGGGHSVYAHTQPGFEENETYMPFAYHGSRVTVLAEQDGYACILYHDNLGERHAAWVQADALSETYPGGTASIGGARSGSAEAVGDPELKWAREEVSGGRRRVTRLEEPVENCVVFTLDYQVIGRNGANPDAILGPRTVYVNDGESWIEVGQFAYDALGPVHVEISLDDGPITLAGVATVAACARPDVFLFRQSLLDVYTD